MSDKHRFEDHSYLYQHQFLPPLARLKLQQLKCEYDLVIQSQVLVAHGGLRLQILVLHMVFALVLLHLWT